MRQSVAALPTNTAPADQHLEEIVVTGAPGDFDSTIYRYLIDS
jgi:hypothetical protein